MGRRITLRAPEPREFVSYDAVLLLCYRRINARPGDADVIRTEESKVLVIKVTIERFTQESQPGWVECSFADAAGKSHVFEEKVPVVSVEDLDARSEYPRPGIIGCQVVGTRVGPDGRELVTVDTEQPWGIESKTGVTRFEVLRELVIEFEQGAG